MIRGLILFASVIAFVGFLINEKYLMVVFCMAVVELLALTKE